MGKFVPPVRGEIKVKPGRRVIWLARPSTLSVGLLVGAFLTIGVAMAAIGVPVVPLVWYTLKPSVTTRLATVLNQPVMKQTQMIPKAVDIWQPAKDETLPAGGWLAIPVIGVKTGIIEKPSASYEEALRQGVWRVPDFGTPLDRTSPTILVAHRFGYLKWSNQYRREHSFYNLPNLKVRDRVFLSWGQREYVYEIYAGDEGTQISDYSADLILYTCQYLESNQRIFRYGRLVKI